MHRIFATERFHGIAVGTQVPHVATVPKDEHPVVPVFGSVLYLVPEFKFRDKVSAYLHGLKFVIGIPCRAKVLFPNDLHAVAIIAGILQHFGFRHTVTPEGTVPRLVHRRERKRPLAHIVLQLVKHHALVDSSTQSKRHVAPALRIVVIPGSRVGTHHRTVGIELHVLFLVHRHGIFPGLRVVPGRVMHNHLVRARDIAAVERTRR